MNRPKAKNQRRLPYPEAPPQTPPGLPLPPAFKPVNKMKAIDTEMGQIGPLLVAKLAVPVICAGSLWQANVESRASG